jgi:hypothetical protein
MRVLFFYLLCVTPTLLTAAAGAATNNDPNSRGAAARGRAPSTAARQDSTGGERLGSDSKAGDVLEADSDITEQEVLASPIFRDIDDDKDGHLELPELKSVWITPLYSLLFMIIFVRVVSAPNFELFFGLWCQQYMREDLGGDSFDTTTEVEESTAEVFQNVVNTTQDTTTTGTQTLQAKHLADYWERLGEDMPVDEVADWIEHSVQLPEFAESFRREAITGYPRLFRAFLLFSLYPSTTRFHSILFPRLFCLSYRCSLHPHPLSYSPAMICIC